MKKIRIIPLFLAFLLFGCNKTESNMDISQKKENSEIIIKDSEVQGEMDSIPLVPVDMDIFDDSVNTTGEAQGVLLEESLDFSSTTINYFNSTEHDTSSFDTKDDGKPLTIIDYGPTGKLPEEMQKPSLYVMFSKPMVPLSKLGEPLTQFKNFTIDPPLEGVYRWYGTNLLSFETTNPILADTEGYSKEYVVTVNKNIRSLTGAGLKEDFSYSFYPKEVKIVNLIIPINDNEVLGRTTNVPFDLAYKSIIRFNMPVDLEYIKEGLDVNVQGKNIEFNLSKTNDNSGDRSVIIEISDDIVFDNNNVVKITLKKGSIPRFGTPKTTSDQVLSYRTLNKFMYESNSSFSYSAPALPQGNRYPLYLYFNQIIDPNQNLVDLIDISLDVDLTDKIFIYGSTIHISNLPVESGDLYTVTLKNSLKDIYGQKLTGGDVVIDVEVPEASSYVRFPDKSYGSMDSSRVGYLESQFESGLIIQHQNLDTLSYGVESISTIITPDKNASKVPVDLTLAKKNHANFEYIDLKSFVNSMGNGSVIFNGEAGYLGYNDREYTREDSLLVQMTDIGVTVRFGYNMILVWSNSLSNGAPIIGADVTLFDRDKHKQKSVKSDKNGLAIFNLKPGEYAQSYFNYRSQSFWVTVKSKNDEATMEVFDNLTPWRHGVSGKRTQQAENPIDRILLFSDRQLYKPGEELSFRGIHWLQQLGEFTPYSGTYTLTLTSKGYKSETLHTLSGTTTTSGGSYGTFKLPEDIKPGKYYLTYKGRGKRGSTEIQIANFRRLNFSVTSAVPDRTFYSGDTISIPVKATYLAGGVMPGANYSYFWTRKMKSFKPSGNRWKPYVFGINRYSGEKTLEQGEGRLSGNGEAQIKQEAKGHENLSGTYQYVLESTVTDIDNQQVSSTASLIVHPSSFYIGAKLGSDSSSYWSTFIKAKEESELQMVLVTPEGNSYNKPSEITMDLYKIEWKSSYQQGVYDRVNVSYRKTEELVNTIQTKSSVEGLAKLKITPETSGSYIARLKSSDTEGRIVETELRFYSYGGGWYYWGGDSDSISLVPDKDLYFVGDKAKIMVQSPLKEGKYLLTVEREGIIKESIIELDENSTMVEIPIEEGYVPQVYVALTSFTNREETPESYFAPDLGKPKNLFGVTGLNVSSITRTLDVNVVSSMESYRPGDQAEIFIKVTRDGKPVPDTELVYLAVDRGVVDLVNYHVPNPLKFFYNPNNFPLYTSGDDLRNYLMDPVNYDVSNLQGGDGTKKMEQRDDFNPLAAFEPFIKTDKKGIAKVTFQLPDTLTTYRSTVIALDKNRIGYSEDEILVKNPINVRTAFPRKLRLRDTSVGNIILQNNTNKEQSVSLTIDAIGIEFPGESVKSVIIPPESIYKVPFLMVPNSDGETEIKITVTSDVLNEILVENIEVEKPLIKESFATTGVVQDGLAEEGLLIPGNIADGYGSYDISLYASMFGMAKSPIRNLRNSKLNLVQRMYNYMPDAVLGEKLLTLGITDNPHGVATVLNSLKSNQTSAGWIKYWSMQERQNIYLDIVSLMFVTSSAEIGTNIPTGLEELLSNSIIQGVKTLDIYGETAAFAGYILNKSGMDVSFIVDKLISSEESIGLTGLGYLTATLADMERDKDSKKTWALAKKFVRPGTRTIDINEPYETRWYFDSEVRQISALILAGLKVDENTQMLQKYVTTLNDRLNTGLWRNRTDYLWSLMAINKIAENDKIDSLDMNVALFMDNKIIVQKGINDLSDSNLDVTLPLFDSPLKDIERGVLTPLKIEKTGVGNIYYSAEINYALPSEVALSRDEGIGLFLEYETLDGEIIQPGDIKIGTTYRVRTVISSSKRRSYLTLDIPVPSGMEIVDPSFVTTSSYKPDGGTESETWTRETSYGDEVEFDGEGYWGYWWYWKNEPDQEIYDNHLTYSWETFYEGKREITFLVRATNPGIYPTPSAQASLMFEPEVFGRTRGSLFVIK